MCEPIRVIDIWIVVVIVIKILGGVSAAIAIVVGVYIRVPTGLAKLAIVIVIGDSIAIIVIPVSLID